MISTSSLVGCDCDSSALDVRLLLVDMISSCYIDIDILVKLCHFSLNSDYLLMTQSLIGYSRHPEISTPRFVSSDSRGKVSANSTGHEDPGDSLHIFVLSLDNI